MSNLYPVDSTGIVLADVDIADNLFDALDAIERKEDPSTGVEG